MMNINVIIQFLDFNFQNENSHVFDQNLTAPKSYYVSIKPQGDCGSRECSPFYSAAVMLLGKVFALFPPDRGRLFNLIQSTSLSTGQNEHPIITSRFICIKIIDSGG